MIRFVLQCGGCNTFPRSSTYSVVIFTFLGLWTIWVQISESTKPLKPELGGLKVCCILHISHEQTQSNRVCYFPTLYFVFTILHISHKQTQSNRVCYFPTLYFVFTILHISHEQTQSNRVCFFLTLYFVFTILHISREQTQSNRVCCFPTL